jgi:exodeoxyribonuclease VII small subunit
MQNTKSIENMSFEEALSELEQIVRKLDSGQESLESSIESYERASHLKAYCEKKLEEAKFKIEKVSKNSEGVIKISE